MSKSRTKASISKLADLFRGKESAMRSELGTIRRSVAHAPSMGDVGENKWRTFFTDYLPKRYQIEKAFVVSSNGTLSDQIDIVIFDRQYSHFVFNHDGLKYVPAESVYAVFELKQNIDKNNLDYTAKKIDSVRSLYRTSVAVPQITGRKKRKCPARIIGGLIALECAHKPPYGNGFKTM